MFSFQQLFLLSIPAMGVLAIPPPYPYASFTDCMSDSDAQQVAFLWTQLVGNYSLDLAQAALAPNYTDYSESASTLNNWCPQAPVSSPPLMDPIFTNSTQFEGGQGMQLAIESKILNVWHTCDMVTMRWVMTNTTEGGRPVVGVMAIDTVKAPSGNKYPYRIDTTYSEFDVGAWIANLKDAGTCQKLAATTS